MKTVVIYHSAADAAEKVQQSFPGHKAHFERFAADGRLTLIGPFSDRSGALSVFTTREAAEAFVRDDPFILDGVIDRWEIHDWDEVLGG